ncbi:MAG: CBS domain-containing protein [Deltaproteobacteria bacterium]|nr:CBS domain-containing protein [Deltaproteobacteria bacterium]
MKRAATTSTAKAKDVMTRKVATIPPEASIATLIERLRTTRFSGFPVVDGAGKVHGLISQNDVLRALAAGASADFQAVKRKASVRLLERGGTTSARSVLALKVRDLMTPKIIGCAPTDALAKVAKLMVSKRVHRVVVLERGKVAGLISATDLVKHVAKSR